MPTADTREIPTLRTAKTPIQNWGDEKKKNVSMGRQQAKRVRSRPRNDDPPTLAVSKETAGRIAQRQSAHTRTQ